ncbi:hypothetical protein [Streptomyces sp. NPDC004629]|uniref:hypothetical protein n=1 Tax=Streptomyces sp. NPDC004629 TaxID=3364705 RepID=UPI0036A0A5A5
MSHSYVPAPVPRPGPAHLAGLALPAERPPHMSERRWADLLDIGWAGQLCDPAGQKRFRLRHHGELLNGMITDVQRLPPLVYAVPPSGKPILLFDGAAHGYNALFCDSWDERELRARRADRTYVDSDGEDTFELVVWTGYNIDWDDEDERADVEDPDAPGLARLVDGRRLPFAAVAAAGFDSITVTATSARGHARDVLSEELA